MELQHEAYMKRCLELARLGEGRTAPNPMVGSVIVHRGKIIGEGYHQIYGQAHAEVNAITAVKDKSLLKQSTLYVNLEPCAHHGKTPPCSDLIIEMEIPEVVIGTVDPFALVAGKGISKLEKAGCKVSTGILHDECMELNRRFFTFHQKKRPYIILKWAETADGFVDTARDEQALAKPTWITNEMARIAVHKQRATEQAILVGTDTAIKDNPSLTLRDWAGKQALRIVIDRFGRLNSDLKLLNGQYTTLVVTNKKLPLALQIEQLIVDVQEDAIDRLLSHLHQQGKIQSLIVEGGPTLLQSFIDRNLWDEAHVYIGQTCFGKGVNAPVFNASPNRFDRFYNSELRIFRNCT